MASLNRHEIIGYLGRDPDSRYTSNGTQVVNFSVASTEKFKDKKTGERKDHTEWHRVICFGRIAEIAAEYLKKGSEVYIAGRSQTRKWTDEKGVDRYITEIIAGSLQMLGKAEAKDGSTSKTAPPANDAPPPEGDDFDDLPF